MSDSENPEMEKQKKRRRRLSIEERIMIIDRLASGYSNGRLAQEFGVSGAAISKIGKNIENYINYNETSDSEPTRRKVFDNTAIEKAIFKWYKQKRCLGEAVPVHVLREKATELNAKMNGIDTFRAGNGWMQRFKERHKIRQFPNQKSDIDDEEAVNYCKELIKLIEDHNIDPDNIYNADEMVLAWKSIPKERSLYKRKTPAANIETVTVMVCCNATGTHKLPLLIIGTDELQEQSDNSSFVYKTQKDGLMNQEIFLQWYEDIYLSQIKEYHAHDNDRCILIIDSAPPHLTAEILNKVDNICDVRPMHFEITPQLQPLNRGIVRKLKALYKTTLINKLLAKKSLDTTDFCNSLILSECCKYLVNAWNEISEKDAKSAWQKVIVREEEHVKFDEDILISKLVPLLRKLPSCSRYNLHNTRDWIEEESDQPGWEVLTDEEILNEVMRDHREAIKQYETQIQNKERKRRKPLANNYESSSNPNQTNVEVDQYTPAVVIKEEIDELDLDDTLVKSEVMDEEEDYSMERNAVFLDEYSDGQLEPESEEEPEQDRLTDAGPVQQIVMKSMDNNSIMIDAVHTNAFASSLNSRSSREDTKKGAIPSAFDAMSSIDIVRKWFEKKKQCTPDDLTRLKQMREIARLEILETVNKP